METDLFGDPIFTGDRQENDYYPTPITCVDPLLVLIDWKKVQTFLEPCRGVARSIYDLEGDSVYRLCRHQRAGRDDVR